MLPVVEDHLDSHQVARVIYGAIIGLALVVALEPHPPTAAVVVGTLLGTGIAVGLAELYSEIVAAEVRTRHRVRRARIREVMKDMAAVVFGISFPAVFFLLSATGAIEAGTAFDLAKWSGLALIGFYGFCAARLAGAGLLVALAQAATVALIGGFLIALKALIH
jgi:hypothetical protein